MDLEVLVKSPLTEGAVEVPPPVEERLRDGQPLAELRLPRAAKLTDESCHLRVLGDVVRENRDQPVAVVRDPAPPDVEVEAAQELPVGARVHDERPTDDDRPRQRVVRVAA